MAVKAILKLGNPCLYDIAKPVLVEEWSMLEAVMKDLHDTLMDFRNTYKAGRAVHGRPFRKMRAFLLLSLLALATCMFCAGCTNKYGDDPSQHGLPTPADTPVPTATPIEK